MDEKVLRELDGYNEIRDEIAISRKFGFDYSIPGDDVDQYVERLHPPMLDLIVSRVIEETPSSKTIRLVSENGYLPPFQAGQYITVIVEKETINYLFDHCNVRTQRNIGEDEGFVNSIANETPLFRNYQAFNFRPDTLSPVIGKGSIEIASHVPFDLDGISRTEAPDLGAYQFVPQEEEPRK